MTPNPADDHREPRADTLPDDETRKFSDDLAALLDAAGFPRMPARLLMALLTSPTGEFTADQISEVLDVSPAAVSGAIRYLLSVQVLRVGSLPGTRRRKYALAPNWYTATLTRRSLYGELSGLAQDRPAAIGPDTPAGRRVQEMADFYGFLHRKFPDLLNEWDQLRREE
ncbi:GbsR/MarR family transcriptional regulator [Pseudactinotalea sp.]|uniref:GbsR/MarR family transcriptional regulator n=1 Tax=Pseudactinotalea sp. TaxID=1926260 RepID=UPI003B3B1039